MPSRHVPLTPAYRTVMATTAPFVSLWGRLEVSGLECIPLAGPVLILANHDSNWDPIAIGMAARPRRQISALAKASLWKNPAVAKVLDGMGQIPLQRGQSDAAALDAAVAALKGGACIGVFPEGTISRGKVLRARSGVGRLAEAVPEAALVCVTVRGTVDLVRMPKRPRVQVDFFVSDEPNARPGESAADLVVRLMAEIRNRAPVALPGRKKTAERYRLAALEDAALEDAAKEPATREDATRDHRES